jgi:hypothetical protein
MKLNFFSIWTYGIFLLTGVFPVLAQPELPAVRVNSIIQVDGLLDEEAWQQAARTDQFTQREPNAGAAASEHTEVFICYDSENLYVAFNCRDRHISDIVATEMRRDEILLNNDCVEIYLDTYNDHRSAFFFATNALAARRDGMITAELAEEAQNWDWNGVWLAAAHIDSTGWIAEFAIPFKNFRFRPGKNQIWGVNFARHIPRKREEVFWSAINRSYGFWGKFRISAYGHFSGLDLLQQPVKWQIKPFSLSGVQRDFTEQSAYDGKLEAGLDARYLLTPNLTATTTLNTDFAQVEADQEQVNLSRFELFFPEKREFFLEGSNSFYFGERLFNPLILPNILFFSRRIGLSDDGELIPLIGGVKINGKEGKSEIGFMNLFTDAISYINEDDEAVDIPRTNYTVARLKQDVLSNSYIGLIGLNKQSLENANYVRNVGMDATIFLAPGTQVGGFIAKSFETANPGKEYAGYLEFLHMDDLFTIFATQNSIQENFNADMGFFPRTDVRGTKLNLGISPRPAILNIRQLWLINDFNYITDQSGTLLTRINFSGFFSLFENGSYILALFMNNYERLTEEFEIHDDVTIPLGIYQFNNWFFEIQSDRSKPLAGLLRLNTGDFFDGTLSSFGAQAMIKVNRHLSIEAGYDLNRVRLPCGNFNTTLIRTRMVYAFHPDLFLKPFVQWNSDDEILSNNFLLNWHYIPGSDLYFVYNEELDFSGAKVRTGNRTVLLKITYLLNL